jgi:Arc/MetJ family transcription regulator
MMRRCYRVGMRTTIDLPDDLHAQAAAIARDTHQSLSQTVAGLVRRGLSTGTPGEIAKSPRTGLPVAHLGRTITSDDVRRLEDDDQ